jgi:Protein of unknown function (DUF3040)
MPLSEHEKRLLAEMEEALAADDPRLISTFSGKTPSRSRVVAGFGLIVVGIFVLFGGLISQTPPLGIAGFVLALVGAVLAISNLGGLMNGAINKMNSPKSPQSGKWSSKFEERWDRRNLEE